MDDSISFRIEKGTNLSGNGVQSAISIINEVPWSIQVKINPLMAILSVFLICEMSDECTHWFAMASSRVEMTIDGEVITENGELNRFDFTSRRLRLLNISSPVNGSFNSVPIWLKIFVQVESLMRNRLTHRCITDVFAQSNIFDTPLIVNDRRIYVNKEFLSLHSFFFFNLFFGDFKEGNAQVFKIDDIDHEDFIVLLKVLYQLGEKISWENLPIILPIADRFDIKSLLDRIELFLIQSKESYEMKLKIGEEYGLHTLIEHCVVHIACEMNVCEAFARNIWEGKDISEPVMRKIVFEFERDELVPFHEETQKEEDSSTLIIPFRISDDIYRSPTITIGGFPWFIIVKQYYDDYIRFELHTSMSERCNLWYSDVAWKVRAIHPTDETKSIIVFDDRNRSRYLDEGIDGLDGFDTEGFIKNGIVHIEVFIKVFGMNGERFRTKSIPDMNAQSQLFGCPLKVGDTTLFVNSCFLSLHSNFFSDGNKSVKLEDECTIHDLLNLLEIIYGMHIYFDTKHENFEKIITLAKQLNLVTLLNEFEKSLMERPGIEDNKLLYLSEKFEFENLWKVVTPRYDCLEKIEELIKSKWFEFLRPSTIEYLDRIIEEWRTR